MSNHQPPHRPYSPSKSHPVELQYDDAGNAYSRDEYGRWIPHTGFVRVENRLPPPPAIPPSPHDNSRHGPNAGVASAFQAPKTGFTFSLQPASSSASVPVASTSQTQHQEVPIDPELISLPDDDDDDDLTNGPTVARALGYAPTKKVAGSRHKDKQPTIEGSIRGKGKGKERAGRADELTSRKRKQPADFDDDTRSTKRGRPQGAGNYSQEDLKALLDATQAELPLGQRGWQNIHAKFTKWARKHGRPDRALKSLETKFKQLVKTTKPTGNGVCPPHVERAHEIEDLINERAGTRDLDDSDFDDVADADNQSHISVVDSDDDDEIPAPKPAPKTAVARAARADLPSTRRRGGASVDLINNLAHAFDPDAQRSRDLDRANRSMQNTQLMALTQQVRDAQQVTEAVRSQLADVQQRLQETDRARDRAEFRLEMIQMSQSQSVQLSERHSRSAHAPRRPKRMHKCEESYPEGGGKTWWVTDDEDMYSDESRDWEDGAYVRPPPRFNHSHRNRLSSSTSRRKSTRFQAPTPPRPLRNSFQREGTPFPHINTRPSDALPGNFHGEAVELTVSPHRGPPVSLIISPSRHSASNYADENQTTQDGEPIAT